MERQPVDPLKILLDNHSDQAAQNMDRILKLREKGQLIIIWGCSDARLILPDDVYQVRTIAGTGPRSPWSNVLNYEKSLGTVIMGHFLCGGTNAKAELSEAILDDDTSLGFVKDHVWSDDPIVQSILTGSWTASRTRKPVMSAVQNPLDGLVYPQGAFNNGSQTEHKTIPTYKLMPKQYVPEEMYGDTIPQLGEDLIQESFIHVLAEIGNKVAYLQGTSPEVFELQTVQDPEVVAVTTNLKPLSARFPVLFGTPNTVFQVSLKRQSLDDESGIESSDVMEAFRQVHYPISYSIENREQRDRAPFKSTRVLYLETSDMRISEGLAKQARRRHWVQEWLELPGRVIIIAEAVKGRITNLELV